MWVENKKTQAKSTPLRMKCVADVTCSQWIPRYKVLWSTKDEVLAGVVRLEYFDGHMSCFRPLLPPLLEFLICNVNDHENYVIFNSMRVFYAVRILPLSLLELLLFALCKVRMGHTSAVLAGEHELLPCCSLWLLSELSKFKDSQNT